MGPLDFRAFRHVPFLHFCLELRYGKEQLVPLASEIREWQMNITKRSGGAHLLPDLLCSRQRGGTTQHSATDPPRTLQYSVTVLLLGGGCKLCGSVEHFKKDCPENQNSGELLGFHS